MQRFFKNRNWSYWDTVYLYYRPFDPDAWTSNTRPRPPVFIVFLLCSYYVLKRCYFLV